MLRCLLCLFLSISLVATATAQVIADDFPVTDNMLRQNSSNRNNGHLYSIDKAWFTNSDSKQTLVVELYTDLHRFQLFLLKNTDLPPAVLSELELHSLNGNTYAEADLHAKSEHINWFIQRSEKVAARYFTTNKGIRIGASKAELLKAYGKPAETISDRVYEVYQWDFTADPALADATTKPERPFSRNSFGHLVTAYLKNDELVALILFNDIP